MRPAIVQYGGILAAEPELTLFRLRSSACYAAATAPSLERITVRPPRQFGHSGASFQFPPHNVTLAFVQCRRAPEHRALGLGDVVACLKPRLKILPDRDRLDRQAGTNTTKGGFGR
jgi:hypothetical protein